MLQFEKNMPFIEPICNIWGVMDYYYGGWKNESILRVLARVSNILLMSAEGTNM